MTVVRLGAWCDLKTEDEYRHELASLRMPADEIEEALEHFTRGASFDVQEFAVLADGRRLTLHSEGGFHIAANTGSTIDLWGHLTTEILESDVRTAVLPDDDAKGEHPWEWLASLLRTHGVEALPEELKQLPYDVVFSPRLLTRLADGAGGPADERRA